MYSLIVQSGKHKGKKIALPDKEVVIGRDETSFIRMTSSEVSRQHCSLAVTDKGLLARDLGSQNGTIVNSVRIESETLLQPGDLLQVGPIVFELAGGRTGKGGAGIDDDIFGWLSEGDTSTDLQNPADTTIVKVSPVAPPAAPQPEPKQKFNTVGEEARDIFRRHFEAQGGA